MVGTYTLIQWALNAKTQGDGYGFPFDQPHLAFAQRLQHVNAQLDKIKNLQLRGQWQDNRPYFKLDRALQPILKDKTLCKAVTALETKIIVADPITVQTPSGPLLIQPQRTNNLLEQFFRSLKRAYRRRTGNASSGRLLRTILAETPLVRNLQNPHYMTLLLNGKNSLEEVFADIEIGALRQAFQDAQNDPERIPAKLKPIIAMPDFPERFGNMVEKAVA